MKDLSLLFLRKSLAAKSARRIVDAASDAVSSLKSAFRGRVSGVPVSDLDMERMRDRWMAAHAWTAKRSKKGAQ